jgi:hypothetical protein
MEVAMLGWMAEMRLREMRSVVSFGLRGKLPSVRISLSVRSRD